MNKLIGCRCRQEEARKNMGNRGVNFNYIGIYVFAYAAAGSLLPFIGQYLSSLGLTGTQVGIVTGGGIVTAVIVAPFWGSLFQRCRNGKHVMENYLHRSRLCRAAHADSEIFFDSFDLTMDFFISSIPDSFL